jgi:hypothetical protein
VVRRSQKKSKWGSSGGRSVSVTERAFLTHSIYMKFQCLRTHCQSRTWYTPVGGVEAQSLHVDYTR